MKNEKKKLSILIRYPARNLKKTLLAEFYFSRKERERGRGEKEEEEKKVEQARRSRRIKKRFKFIQI